MNGLDKVIEHLNHAHRGLSKIDILHTVSIAYLMLRKFFRSILVMIIYYVGRHGKLDIGWDMILSLTWMT